LFRFAFFEDQMEQFLVFFHSDSDQIPDPGPIPWPNLNLMTTEILCNRNHSSD
jgi:hypothetical protein